LLNDFGTFAIATTSVGVNMDIADTAFEAQKVYWIAFVNQTVATSLRFMNGISPYVHPTSSISGATQSYPAGFYQSSVSGALPASASGSLNAAAVPLLWLSV
jgi:hypothetical protein